MIFSNNMGQKGSVRCILQLQMSRFNLRVPRLIINRSTLVFSPMNGRVQESRLLLKKAGSRNDPSSYRPISLIQVVSKVFERIIYDELYHYLNENDLLSRHQSGFRPLHSTNTALIEATDNWSLNIDHGFINAFVFLDLKKAFDTVDRNILLSKL